MGRIFHSDVEMTIKLQELLQALPGYEIRGEPLASSPVSLTQTATPPSGASGAPQSLQMGGDVPVSSLAYDSRKVRPGSLFVAVRGMAQDGHSFIPEAQKKGASFFVVEEFQEGVAGLQIRVSDSRRALALLSNAFFGYPSRSLLLVGITGTNGKTTTSLLVERILKEAGYSTGLIGTIQYRIKEKVLQSKNTTPESLDLQELLFQMKEEGVKAVSMEVSSHALALDRVYGIPFDVGIFTNLTQDHLDFHKDLQNYFEAKARLFTSLGQDQKASVAVVNLDDPYGKEIIGRVSVPVMTYGTASHAQIYPREVSVTPHGIFMAVSTPQGELPLHLKLTAKFNISNSLAALAAALALKIPLEKARSGIEAVTFVRGRFEPVRCGQPFQVIIDYAHTPDGLKNLLEASLQLTKGKLITVFGCGGDRDRKKRPLMGKIAVELSTLCIVTSDNPRSEEPAAIISEIQAGMKEVLNQHGRSKQHLVEPDRKKAIALALSLAKEGDTVVIAGKGHETYQIFKDTTIHFDDREVVQSLLGGTDAAPCQ